MKNTHKHANTQIRTHFNLNALCALALFASLQANATTYQFTDLGASIANGINNEGQAVGAGVGGYFGPATLWNGSTATVLSDALFSVANGINNAGQVAGVSSTVNRIENATPYGMELQPQTLVICSAALIQNPGAMTSITQGRWPGVALSLVIIPMPSYGMVLRQLSSLV